MFPILIPFFSRITSSAVFFSSFAWKHLHSCFLLLINTKQVGFICFCILKLSILIFCRYSVFCLVNHMCDTYLAIDNRLVYSHPKIFLLFFSVILSLVPNRLSRFILQFFYIFLFMLCSWIKLFVELEFCHRLFPACKSCFSIFHSQ